MKKIIVLLLAVAALSARADSFEKLPLGDIKASGWLLNQIERDITTGYISVYDKLQPTMQGDAFGPVKKKNYSISKTGAWETRRETWWAGEHEGYWADLVVRNAYVSGYKPWMEKARAILDKVVANQEPSGYIGIYDEECRLDNLLNENGELWAQSRMLNALLAMSEYSGDKRYYDAAKRAADYTISRYIKSGKSYFNQPKPNGGGLTHGLMFCETMEWLYGLTGDRRYLDFALWLYDDYSKAPQKIGNVDCQLGNLLDRNRLFAEHSVHVLEHIRVVFWLCSATGRADLRQACDNIFYKYSLSKCPTGAIAMDHIVHESVMGNYGSPTLPYEYCSITEGCISFSDALRRFGGRSSGDMVESLMFNAAQGARLPDGKAISYSTFDNRFDALFSSGFRSQVAACHSVACCNLNAGKVAAYYVANMWMKAPGGILAALYGPSALRTEIAGTTVAVDEKTMYPFENSVVFEIAPEKPVKFTLTLRDPEWSASTVVTAPGAAVERRGDGYITVTKEWRKGDRVEVVFGDGIVLRHFINNENYVQRGALIYALPIADKRKATKTFPYDGLANFDIEPGEAAQARKLFDGLATPAHPALLQARKPDSYKYTPAANPNRDYPFDTPYGTISAPFLLDGQPRNFDLVPVGSAVLRKVTFPESTES